MATESTGLGGDDTLIGTDGGEKIVAGGGDDFIDGGAGSDFINAGGGNDTIIYDEADYKILGGGGIDTLWFLGYQQKLNLSASVVNGIEKLWLDGGGGHLVTLTAADVIRISDTDQMEVIGTATDRLAPGSGWSFAGLSADGQSQILKNGMATLIVSLPVFVEGFSGNASITVTSTSDTGNSVSEDTPDDQTITLIASGSINLSDVNAGQNHLLGKVIQSGAMLGSLQLNAATGSDSLRTYGYTYAVDNAKVQFLREGQTVTDSFTVTSIDGTTKTVDFTITGKNDRARISDVPVTILTEDGNMDEDGFLVAVGNITILDPDQGESSFKTLPLNGSLGGNLAIDPNGTPTADGSHTYAFKYTILNSAVQGLKSGETANESFSIVSLDGTQKSISFSILGADDPTIITVPDFAALIEDQNVIDGYLTRTVTLSISDPDHGDAYFQHTVTSASTSKGSLEFLGGGDFVYKIANSDVQYLKTGESRIETFTVISADGTTKSISFTVNGADDATSITIPPVSDLSEDVDVIGGKLTRSAKLTAIDPDHDGNGFQTETTSVTANFGSLTLDDKGTYTYSIDNSKIQYLKDGDNRTETFTVKSLDGTSANISFKINGANDAPVLYDTASSKISDSVAELPSTDPNAGKSTPLTRTGSFKVQDVDLGDSLKSALTSTDIAGKYGTLSFSISDAVDSVRTINWTYSFSDQRLNHLPAGTAPDEVFTIQLKDSAGAIVSQAITIKVTGANDPAVIGNPTAASVTEDVSVENDSLKTTGTISISDPDEGQANFKTSVTSAAGNLGSLVLSDNGGYTYSVLNSDVQYLTAGVNKTDTFTVTATDGTTKDIVFTIFGADDEILGDSGNNILNGTEGPDVIRGKGGNDLINGLGGNDFLYGDEGDDILQGGDGNDWLDGGPGNDDMVGGSGDDTYYVDSPGDKVTESPTGGIDIVYSSVSFTLPSYVERLTLTGNGNIDGNGNSLDNIINGNNGNNYLRGGGGFDVINGGGGDDTIELSPGQGGNINGGDDQDLIIFSLPVFSNLTINGGNGADTFKFYKGNLPAFVDHPVTINGFNAFRSPQEGGDQLSLQGMPSDYEFSLGGGGLQVKSDGQVLMTLVGVFDLPIFLNNGHAIYFT